MLVGPPLVIGVLARQALGVDLEFEDLSTELLGDPFRIWGCGAAPGVGVHGDVLLFSLVAWS
jgi:hypothetical protein